MAGNIKSLVILFLLIAGGLWYVFHDCKDNVPIVNLKPIQDSIKAEKAAIIESKAETATHKEKANIFKKKAAAIAYRTTFDSTATIDTVKVELVKADSSNVLKDSTIKEEELAISLQDTTIVQEEHIVSLDSEQLNAVNEQNKALRQQHKKDKRKLFVAKLITVGVVIGSAILIISIL